MVPTLKEENNLWKKGFKYVAGVDEVGRGAWAGPLVAAAVMFPDAKSAKKIVKLGLKDSKLLSPSQRNGLVEPIKSSALAVAISQVGITTINRVGMATATQFVLRKALRTLDPSPDYHLVDYFHLQYIPKSRQKGIKQGDKVCASIAAASVLAKVYRDNLLEELHYRYRPYKFGDHKGYGTKIHQQAIKTHGLTRHHRKNFIPTALLS